MKKSLTLFGLLAIVALCVSATQAEDNGYYKGDHGRTSLPPGAQRQQSGGGGDFNVGAKLAFWKPRTKAPDENCCGNDNASSNYTDQGREEFQRPAPQGVILDPSLPIGVVNASPAPEPDPGLQGTPVHQRTGSCGGKGKICFIPETHTVKVPGTKCVERTVCCPQLAIGPCGISFQNVERQITMRVPTLVEKEVTTYRRVHEPCQCNKCNGG